MAIVHKCDVCKRLVEEGVDISASNRPKLRTKILGTEVELEVIIGIDGIINGGHICNRCLSSALLMLAEMLEKNEPERKFDRCDEE